MPSSSKCHLLNLIIRYEGNLLDWHTLVLLTWFWPFYNDMHVKNLSSRMFYHSMSMACSWRLKAFGHICEHFFCSGVIYHSSPLNKYIISAYLHPCHGEKEVTKVMESMFPNSHQWLHPWSHTDLCSALYINDDGNLTWTEKGELWTVAVWHAKYNRTRLQ